MAMAMALALGGLGVVVSWALSLGAWISVALVAAMAYAPSFLDGSEYRAEGRLWWEAVYWGGWKAFLPGCELHVDGKYDHNKQIIFAAFPHGVISYGHLALCTDVVGWFSNKHHPQDRRDLGAYVVHKIPFYRDLMLWLGVVDAGLPTAKKLLTSGRSMYLIPGGVMEQMLTIEGRHRVYLNTRKGFVRLAVEFGTDLVPIYTFGETSLFSLSPFLLNFRLWIASKFQVATPIFYSKRWGIPIPFMKHSVPLKVCVGPPIKVNQISPSHPNFHQYVDEMHAEFKEALKELFERHKVHCGYPDATLEFLPKEKNQ